MASNPTRLLLGALWRLLLRWLQTRFPELGDGQSQPPGAVPSRPVARPAVRERIPGQTRPEDELDLDLDLHRPGQPAVTQPAAGAPGEAIGARVRRRLSHRDGLREAVALKAVLDAPLALRRPRQ